MYCSTCGSELAGTEGVCPTCGAVVAAGGRAAVAPAARPAHTSFEYARTTVANDLVTVTCDCYENLGWELTGSKATTAGGSTVLSFRRSRKIKSKAQLVKIQRTMDDLIATIAGLEGEKTRKARMRAITVGIVAALVLGVGMCLTMVWDAMIPGIIVGVLGIAGCAGAWLLYRSTVEQETARVTPRIEAAYDGLATACEEAQTVLSAAA